MIIVEAVYENGVLKPTQPLPLMEHERVQVILQSTAEAQLPSGGDDLIERSYGLMGWKGTSEELAFFALDPELDPQFAP